MKFAKELEENHVPEWRDKYLDYGLGKKKIKAFRAALRTAQRKSPFTASESLSSPERIDKLSPLDKNTTPDPKKPNVNVEQTYPALPQPIPIHPHSSYSHGDGHEIIDVRGQQYHKVGSIVGSPPSAPTSRPASLNLGQPALGAESTDDLTEHTTTPASEVISWRHSLDSRYNDGRGPGSAPQESTNAFEVGATRSPSHGHGYRTTRMASESDLDGRPSFLRPQTQRASTGDDGPSSAHARRSGFRLERENSLFRRMLRRKRSKRFDVPLQSQEIGDRKKEFFEFLTGELDKIETFYEEKEREACDRLHVLLKQLHMLRDHRAEEVMKRQQEAADARRKYDEHMKRADEQEDGQNQSDHDGTHLIDKIRNIQHSTGAVLHPSKIAKQVHFGGTPKILGSATPPTKPLDSFRDYSRRPSHADTSYTTAKRKLKRALQEYHRGLELLKSYAMLNRTAFRKINKKFDKASADERPKKYKSLDFYHTRVETSGFVKSITVDDLISKTEDLYARYFYNANRKIAVSKLRIKTRAPNAFTQSVFRNGLTLGLGSTFAIEAVIKAANAFYDNEVSNPGFATTTSYVLQIYAGYFLLLLLMLLFCLDCKIFHDAKVNYVFVFEFDTHHNLDWRQLSEIPCALFLLMSLFMWLNFSLIGGMTMYIYWPVVLIGLSIAIVFLPLKVLYHESRLWLIRSMSRLFTPFLRVEFRDFFLGDMMCSETYSIGGIELFFCLYAHHFGDPDQCNSSHSYLMGFLTTLPGIIRLLQCFKRYYDTKQGFPHLANAAKYGCTILQYMTLSFFRLDRTLERRAVFILFATINGIYTSFWDLAIDWSLFEQGMNRRKVKNRFLRQRVAYKAWWYYLAMVIDPILRFNWIFFAFPIFTDEIQHSAVLGFLVSMSEVMRRGIWVIFRVENEHSTNVGRFRASRDTELPYDVSGTTESSPASGADGKSPTNSKLKKSQSHISTSGTAESSVPPTKNDIEASPATRASASAGQRSLHRFQDQQGITPSLPSPGQTMVARVGTILRGAHAQDFERKRKPPDESYVGGGSISGHAGDSDEDDSDEPVTDDEEEEEVGNKGGGENNNEPHDGPS